MAQRFFDIFRWEVQSACPSCESGLFQQLIDEVHSDPSSAGHGSYHVGGFHFLYSVVVQGLYSLLIFLLAWSMSYWRQTGPEVSSYYRGFAYQSLQFYQFLPHVFWHFIVRYIHFRNFCVFFRKLTSLTLWNAPLYPWWSLESSEVSA